MDNSRRFPFVISLVPFSFGPSVSEPVPSAVGSRSRETIQWHASALRDKLAEGDMCGLNVIALHRNRGIASLFTSFRRRLPAQVSVPKGRDPAVEHVLHLCKTR